MRRFLLSVLLLAFITANAQNTYILKQETATYTELTNDTVQPQINWGSGDIYWLNFLTGETFNLFGENVTFDNTAKLFTFSTNGLVRVDNGSSGSMIFDGLFRTLDSVDASTAISYKEEGTGSNKIIKVQWKNLSIQSGPANNYVNFQIWVYANGIVEYRYGPSSSNNASGYTQSIGPSIGIAYANTTFTQMLQKLWVKNTPSGLQLDSATTISFPNSEAVPANGTVFRFVPKSIATSVGAMEVEKELKIYPNPANDKVYIDVKGTGMVRIEDMTGRVIKEKSFDFPATVVLETGDLPAGMYNVSVNSNDSYSVQKLVINR